MLVSTAKLKETHHSRIYPLKPDTMNKEPDFRIFSKCFFLFSGYFHANSQKYTPILYNKDTIFNCFDNHPLPLLTSKYFFKRWCKSLMVAICLHYKHCKGSVRQLGLCVYTFLTSEYIVSLASPHGHISSRLFTDLQSDLASPTYTNNLHQSGFTQGPGRSQDTYMGHSTGDNVPNCDPDILCSLRLAQRLEAYSLILTNSSMLVTIHATYYLFVCHQHFQKSVHFGF